MSVGSTQTPQGISTNGGDRDSQKGGTTLLNTRGVAQIWGKKIEKIDLLKMDVQRSEWYILQGIKDEDWGKIRQISFELHLLVLKHHHKLLNKH